MHRATLVLEGGATRGVFTSGALDYLMEQDLYTSHVIGVSAGACNASGYVSKQIGRTRDCMIHKEKELSYYYGFHKFLKERSLMNMDMIFDQYPNKDFPFDFDTYFSSGIECEIVTTNCITGQAEYMTETQDNDRLMKICRASASMPLLTPIVNIDGMPYLDGGLADSVPLGRALKKENKNIVLILTRNAGYRKSQPSKALARVYRTAYKNYPNLVRTILRRSYVYNKTMKKLNELERAGEIFVLRPTVEPVARLEKDYDTLMRFYEHGYETMKVQYEHLQTYLNRKEGISYASV